MRDTKTLDGNTLLRLQRLCGLLGTEHAGERAAAGAKADALLRERDLRWPDVLTSPALPAPETPQQSPQHEQPDPDPPPSWDADWRGVAAWLLRRHQSLTCWEVEFAYAIHGYRKMPSLKQRAILKKLLDRVVANLRVRNTDMTPAWAYKSIVADADPVALALVDRFSR